MCIILRGQTKIETKFRDRSSKLKVMTFSFPLQPWPDDCLSGMRRKRTFTEVNAKCRHLKLLTCKGTFRQVFICLSPRIPYPSPLTHCIRVYCIPITGTVLIHTGKGEGGELNQREG